MGGWTDRARRSGRYGAALALGLLAGCRGAGEYTDTLAPIWWRQNLWGPEAHAARASGRLPEIPRNPDMAAWEDFARDHLRDGDVLFREADARVFMGLLPFSRIAGKMADCEYTHTGIFAWEGGLPVVYDTSMAGARRQRFGVWVLDNVGHVGIKRPRPEYRGAIPGALAFCRDVYERQVPFDARLEIGDTHYYCAEMTTRAYESAGLMLGGPVKMGDLPRIDEFRRVFMLARLLTPFHPDQEMYAPGNDEFGIWSSPALEAVYVSDQGARPDPNGLIVSPSPQSAPPMAAR